MGIKAPVSTWTMTASGERIDWNDIKGRVDLARVVTALLGPAAKRQGRRLLWPCPFHDDRDPSFEVDPGRQTWRCWPCNLGGDAPALVMKRDGVGFPEAVRIVAELSGIVTASGRSASPPPRPATPAAASKPAKAASRAARAIVRLAPGRCPGPRDRGRRSALEARGDRGPGLSPPSRTDR